MKKIFEKIYYGLFTFFASAPIVTPFLGAPFLIIGYFFKNNPIIYKVCSVCFYAILGYFAVSMVIVLTSGLIMFIIERIKKRHEKE